MNHLNPHKTGLAIGTLAVTVHLIWVILVALGWAEPLMNFSMWAHMVRVEGYMVQPFDLTAAVTVLVAAGLIGFVVGNIAARIFNRIAR